jgi:hypothetical protein
VDLDQSFTMAPGETVNVTGAGISLRFDGVEGDSRCPADAICVLGGDAEVRLTVAGGSATRQVSLHTGSMAPVAYDGFTLRLMELSPYPFSARPIATSGTRGPLAPARRLGSPDRAPAPLIARGFNGQ